MTKQTTIVVIGSLRVNLSVDVRRPDQGILILGFPCPNFALRSIFHVIMGPVKQKSALEYVQNMQSTHSMYALHSYIL